MIGVEGTKTPVGDSGNVETPQRASARRLNSAPRKAKCLQRKSTDSYTAGIFLQITTKLLQGLDIIVLIDNVKDFKK
ncbi:hypothetical protein EVU96_00380 [Bacillus infantis]|uniref:Uncharacterized protein n=1 Tax=Bacillus infantis TaxID=324767 RepID=A0A5D4SM57_9BACI|nr:hypothetical protein EVU96_00380 [Bacillus infantis]TYS63192.1 hypothetical protein FZD47_16195 [Bacillus infantis]